VILHMLLSILMSMTFHCTKLHLSRVHALSPKNKMLILNFNHPPCSYFWFFTKVVSLRVVHSLKFYQNTKFHGPTLTDASFAYTPEV
jgi:hypothetical protein